MKKRYLTAVLAMILIFPAIFAFADLVNVTTKGVDGDLCFYDASGNEIYCIESTNRLVSVPSGSAIDVESGGSLKLAGTAITSTAAELNKLASIGAGDVLTTTNTKTVTNKTLTTPTIASFYSTTGVLISAPTTTTDTLAGIATEQTFTNKTLTTPIIASFYQDAAKTKLVTVPATTDTLATLNDTETLTNKTLTSPVINTPSVVQSVAFHNYGASSADWILSATEQKAVLLWVTNAGAASNIVAPAEARVYFVYNNSGQNVTIAAGGTGITVADARVAGVIYASGDYVRLTPDGAFQ